MTASTGPATAAGMYRATTIARHRAEALIAGTGLTIREQANELVITNPVDPERGEIHVAYANGYVSWVRPVWEHWGYLAGYDDPENETPGQVGPEKILAALAAPAPGAAAP